MKTLVLAGQPWTVYSPSKFAHVAYPVWLVYDGAAWRLAVNGTQTKFHYRSRNAAAQVVSLALDPDNLARFM